MTLTGVFADYAIRIGRRAARCALLFALLLGLAAAAPAPAASAEQARVLFVASQRSEAYTGFVSLTTRALGTGNPLAVSSDTRFAGEAADQEAGSPGPEYDLVVAMGTRAARALAQHPLSAPVIYTLIPELTFQELRQSGDLPCQEDLCTAVYIDQPLDRQVRVLHAAFGHRRVGVLFGPTSRRYRGALADATDRYALPLVTAQIEDGDELLSALRETLRQVDVLLALPDPAVYNSRTAQSVLLTTYRYKVPMVAFSRAYVDAGATLSVYSTPEQMAAQTAGIIREFLHGDRSRLPAPAYPEAYRVHVNRHVARSIDLKFEDNPELQSIMQEHNDE